MGLTFVTVRKVLLVLTECLLAQHLANETPATASFWQNEVIIEVKYAGLINIHLFHNRE
jgi:hypothetical protein